MTRAKKATRKPARKPAKKTASRESAAARRKRFAEAFLLNDGNITKAALAVGFAPKSAASQGSRLLKHPQVQQFIQQRRAEIQHKAELSTEDLARALRQNLLFDPRKLFKADGTLIPVHELDADVAANLTALEVTESTEGKGESKTVIRTAKVKFEGKSHARDQLARMLGAYEKDNRQRTDPLTQLLGELQKTRSAVPIAQEPAT